MAYSRILSLPTLLKKNSFFLFGARGTGKSTLIREQLGSKALLIDLLDSRLFRRLQADPVLLEGIIQAQEEKSKVVVIDEVQKIPELLDEVHRLIEKRKVTFLLCGSSARKLKKAGTNLLAGRAWRADLFSLVSDELKKDFDLEKILRWGSLPRVWQSAEPQEELDAYVDTYLKEEILQESLVRKLPQFTNFLKMAAMTCGHLLNYEALSQEIGVSAPTIRDYYSILKDSLLAFEVEPFQKTKKRKSVATSKIFFFDIGITNTLAEVGAIDRASDLYGRRFEQFIGVELKAYLSYHRKKKDLCFWRSLHERGNEVDFVIGRDLAVEVKATRKISRSDLKGLQVLKEEGIVSRFVLVSNDPIVQEMDGVLCLPIDVFLSRLWKGRLA